MLDPVNLHPKAGEVHMRRVQNFPYYQLARVAGPQLMVGNVLVVRHAGCVPQCAVAFKKSLLDASAPVGAYTSLIISYERTV